MISLVLADIRGVVDASPTVSVSGAVTMPRGVAARLEEDGCGRPAGKRGRVGEDAHDVAAAHDFLVQPFQLRGDQIVLVCGIGLVVRMVAVTTAPRTTAAGTDRPICVSAQVPLPCGGSYSLRCGVTPPSAAREGSRPARSGLRHIGLPEDVVVRAGDRDDRDVGSDAPPGG